MGKSIVTILVLLLLTIIVLIPVSITGFSTQEVRETPYDYIWTTAKCTGSLCADYEVTCKNGNVVSQERVTEFINLGDNWEDPRDSFELCR